MNEPNLHLMHRLRTHRNDANNHIIAKALYYYEGIMESELRAELHIMIQEALKTDDWSALHTRMRRWW